MQPTPPLSTTPLQRLDAALGRLRRLWDNPAVKDRLWVELGQRIDFALFRTLRAIEAAPSPGVGDVAETLGVDISTASRFVDQAVSRGFVSRGRDATDGRRCVLALTAAGEDLLNRATEARGRLLGEMTEGWPPDDIATLARLLDRLAQSANRLE